MATRKPISTVSYNTEAFLKEKLDSWVKAHMIQAYFYICHKGEDGDKDHIHLRIEPNKELDMMDLTEALKEYPAGCEKPLGVRPWRPSKEEDAILYFVHDEKYLAMKYGGGEKGEKIPYKLEDFRCSEGYDMDIAYIRAKASMEHTTVNMASRMRNGETSLDLILKGENPYTVNAIMRVLYGNDYERAVKELNSLRDTNYIAETKLNNLIQAVKLLGYEISFDEELNAELTPKRKLKN